MFVLHNTGAIFPGVSSDLISESLGAAVGVSVPQKPSGGHTNLLPQGSGMGLVTSCANLYRQEASLPVPTAEEEPGHLIRSLAANCYDVTERRRKSNFQRAGLSFPLSDGQEEPKSARFPQAVETGVLEARCRARCLNCADGIVFVL